MSSAVSSFFTRVGQTLVNAVVKAGIDLFLISVLILFLELACIRWFPAHVVFLTFFTNVVLLACFIGMSVGCLAASHKRNYITWTPLILAVTVLLALGVELWMNAGSGREYIDVAGQSRPDVVFFGTEYDTGKLERFSVPIEVVGGIGLWAYNPPAIVTAVKDKVKDKVIEPGQVKIVGFDEDPVTLDGIADGTVHGTVVQDPFNFGYQAVKIMAALAKDDRSVLPPGGILDVPHRVITKNGGAGRLPVAEFRAELNKLLGK